MASKDLSTFISSSNRLNLLVVVLVLLISLAALFHLLSTAMGSYNYTSMPAQVSVTQSQQASSYSSQVIVNQQFFGQAETQTDVNINLPETTLALQLRGAFTASDPKQASAIIETSDKTARHYTVGSQVQGGLTLHAVHHDRVVLSNSGILETLYFPSIEESSVELGAVGEKAAEVSTAEVPQRTKTETMSKDERQALIRKRLEQLRNRNRANR